MVHVEPKFQGGSKGTMAFHSTVYVHAHTLQVRREFSKPIPPPHLLREVYVPGLTPKQKSGNSTLVIWIKLVAFCGNTALVGKGEVTSV